MAVKVFLFMGQSNMQGHGNRTQLYPVPVWAQTASNGWTGAPTVSFDSGIQYAHPTLANSPSLYTENNGGILQYVYDAWGNYDGNSWYAADPYHPSPRLAESSGYGPELSFLAKYRAANPSDEIAVVKCVLGGSSITDWLPGGGMDSVWKLMVDQSIARLNAAGKTFEWAGFFWHQGENGCSSVYSYLNPTPPTFTDKTRSFFASVRDRTSSSLKIGVYRLGNHMLLDNIILPQATGGINTQENLRGATEARRAEQWALGAEPGNFRVDTDNLPVLQTGPSQWWYHHPGTGHLAMGERTYYGFSGATPPPPPAPFRIIINGGSVYDGTGSATLDGVSIAGSDKVLNVVY